MGQCLRNFNTDKFKEWLSTLHEGKPGTKFCKKEDDQTETYHYLNENLHGQIVVWNNRIVEEIITDRKTDEQVFYLHYEMEDCAQIKDLINNFKSRMFCVCQKEYSISHDDTERNILLCCSSALTTTMFADMLQKFSNENHLPYHFSATSIHDSETLSQDFDLILMAPQVQHYTKQTAERYHKKFLNMNTSDFAQYNCRNIISRIQETFI